MDTDLEYFSCREKAKEVVFSKPFQNGFQKLSEEEQGFQIARFSFFREKILNLSQDFPPDIKQFICQKARNSGEAKQEHIMNFLVTVASLEFIFKE